MRMSDYLAKEDLIIRALKVESKPRVTSEPTLKCGLCGEDSPTPKAAAEHYVDEHVREQR